MPFDSEWMTCALCNRQQQANPNVSSDWRTIDLGGRRFYVCPKHFPSDGASAKAYEKAYTKVLRKLLNRLG